MEKILKELDEAYTLLGAISLRGEPLDVMAAARSKLRKAYADLKKTQDRTGSNPNSRADEQAAE